MTHARHLPAKLHIIKKNQILIYMLPKLLYEGVDEREERNERERRGVQREKE
jgi:hypothetical protein